MKLLSKSFLTRNVLLLAAISFFTDIASEMLFPVLPLYLTAAGYGVAAIGLIEGVAAIITGFSKFFSGTLADNPLRRRGLVRLGYALSAMSKPLIGLTSSLGVISVARFSDRLGKGIRTTPRDAMLAAESPATARGKVFGFHRSMDTLGAVFGPIITFVILFFAPDAVRLIFLLALIPGVIAVALTFFLRSSDDKRQQSSILARPVISALRASLAKLKASVAFFRSSNKTYRRLLGCLFLVSALRGTDMFLLLRAHEAGVDTSHIIIGYILFNVIFALAAVPVGIISDRFGYKIPFALGLSFFATVYLLLSSARPSMGIFIIALLLYGIFVAVHESLGSAWVSLHTPSESAGTGLGAYLMLASLGTFIGCLITGTLWGMVGAANCFAAVGIAGIVGTLLMIFCIPGKGDHAPAHDPIGCASQH